MSGVATGKENRRLDCKRPPARHAFALAPQGRGNNAAAAERVVMPLHAGAHGTGARERTRGRPN